MILTIYPYSLLSRTMLISSFFHTKGKKIQL
uniref:Uncharacterized protein n=1 Tax=Rhizophora mucronata TaxID=61149 RepID=A0A2P2N5F3_RHIMU